MWWKSPLLSFAALGLAIVLGSWHPVAASPQVPKTAPDVPAGQKQDPSPGSGATIDEKAPDWFKGAEVLPQPGVAPPTLVKRATPDYPAGAAFADVTGEVWLDARVEVDGRVSKVRIVRSIVPLDTAAERAAKKFEFRPARKDGQPVPAIVRIVMEFNIRRNPSSN